MAEQEARFKAEEVIRESLRAGLNVLAPLVKRLYPEKTVRRAKRDAVNHVLKRVVK